MPSWDDVRRIALALAGAEESTHYGGAAVKVNGRAFVNPSSIDGAIMLRCSDEEARLLISAKPDVYFLTPHYEGWGVLLRLDAADADELAGAIEDSYAHERAKKPLRPRTAARARRGSS
jgi:hypothetical protein